MSGGSRNKCGHQTAYPRKCREIVVIFRSLHMSDRADDLANKAQPVGQDGLWTRDREQVIKVAMILAIARHPAVPEIEDADLDFAEAMVMHSCKYMEHFASGEIADTQNERDIRTVSKAMRGSGWMTKTGLACGLKSLTRRMRTDLIKDLIEQQKIETRQVETGGRPSTQFKWMNN